MLFPEQEQSKNEKVASRFGEFSIVVRPPTYDEILEDEGRSLYIYSEENKGPAHRERGMARLATITGWRDVSQKDSNGNEVTVPYSLAKLLAVMAMDKQAALSVSKIVNQAFNPSTVPVGEFGPQSASTAAASGTSSQNTSDSLPPTPSGGEQQVSASGSA